MPVRGSLRSQRRFSLRFVPRAGTISGNVSSSVGAESVNMPIRITCPGCQKTLLVPDQLAGKKVRCKGCASALAVPANGAPGATSPPKGILPVSRPPVAKGTGAPPGMKTNAPAAKPGAKPATRKPVLRSKPADLEALAAESLGLDEKPNGSANGANGTNGTHTNGNGAAAAGAADPAAKPPIKFNCTFCDEEVTLDASQAGKQVPCPSCTRIVRVPMPKEVKPKDWRTVEKKGPSAALANQPEKLENAWGTENNAKVSQKALIEAGVVAKAPKKKLPVDERIARWVKRGLLAAVVVGLGAWLYTLSRQPADDADFVKIEKDYNERDLKTKWPPLLRAEFRRVIGERRLQAIRATDPAQHAVEEFWLSRDAAMQPGDGKQKLDRDFFLIELARTQLELGGGEDEIVAKQRVDWQREVATEMKATLNRIDNPEVRLLALRVLKQPLLDRKQATVYSFLSADVMKPFAIEFHSQIETCEKARQGKLEEALKSARDKKADPAKRFDLAVGVATLLREETPDKTDDCKAAIELATGIAMTPEFRDRLPQWPLLQLVRLVARMPDEAEKAPKLIEQFREKGKEKAFERRAKFEIQLARLEKAPNFDEATAIIADIEPDGQGIAWMAWARAAARAGRQINAPDADDKHFDFLITTALPILVPQAPK
jgi:ribosomal protein S27E